MEIISAGSTGLVLEVIICVALRDVRMELGGMDLARLVGGGARLKFDILVRCWLV